MKSEWLQHYEEEIESLKRKKRSVYKKICIPIVLTFIILLICAYKSNITLEGHIALGAVTITAVIVLVTIYMTSLRKGNPALRNRLSKLLKTKEEVAEFDFEMMSEPLYSLKLQHKAGEVRLMRHYISQYNTLASSLLLHTYTIIKLDSIKSIKIYISSEQKIQDKKFNLVCRDYRNRIIGSLTVYRKKDYLEIKEALKQTYPELRRFMEEEIYYDSSKTD